jgi:hypothetical protein
MAQTGNNKIDFSDLTPSEIIKQIYNKVDWMSHVNDRLEFKEYSLPQDANESLDNLVSLYTNKKSKRVGYAGKKLKKLFVDLPGVEQRKVGLALLMGNMTDSEWVCKRLNNYKPSFDKDWIINWHPCYENAVEECWNKYHGKYCGRILIQFCPEDIVRKYIDNLIDNDNYFYICRRFVNKPWFKLDIEKLKRCTFINAYLSIMYKTEKGIPEDEARLLLYQWIGVLTNYYKKIINNHSKENIFYNNKSKKLRIIHAWGIDTALYYLLCMKHYKVVSDFLDWDQSIFEQYYDGYFDCEEEHVDTCHEDLKEIIENNFPDDLKHLLYLNDDYYFYLFSPGQPYTIPRIFWYSEREIPPYILPESIKNKNESTSSLTSDEHKFNEETYQHMLESNPILANLVDKLNLSPIHSEKIIEKNTKYEDTDDLYLIKHDLPF